MLSKFREYLEEDRQAIGRLITMVVGIAIKRGVKEIHLD